MQHLKKVGGKIVDSLVKYARKYIPNYETITEIPNEHLETIKATLPHVTSINELLEDCENLQKLDTTGWDTSNITDMDDTFYGISQSDPPKLNLDLSSFNTSNVTEMISMFGNICANKLNLSSFDTSKVTDMSDMFYNFQSNEELDLSSFNTSSVKDMEYMFYDSNIKSINLSSFDTSNVTDMACMFSLCKVKSLDLSTFNTKNCLYLNLLFAECLNIQILDISNFDANTNNNYLNNMFENCISLKYIILNSTIIKFIPDSDDMFRDCPSDFKILVPSSSLNEYKSNNAWKAYVNHFDAIENYTIIKPGDGTITVTPK